MRFFLQALSLWSIFLAIAQAESKQCAGHIAAAKMLQIPDLQPLAMDRHRGYKPAWMAIERRYRSAVLEWGDEGIRESYLENRNSYLDFYMLHERLRRIQLAHPKSIEIWTIAETHFGFPVYAVLVGDSTVKNKSSALQLGGLHGNEMLSVNYVLDALEDMLGDSAEQTNLLRQEWNFWFVPMANPDGNWLSMRRAHAESYGKKNGRNTDGTCETFGYEGVDLSDNFPWKSKNSEIEAETQSIMNLVESGSFLSALSYHSGGNGLYTPSLQPTEKEGERLLISSFVGDFTAADPSLEIVPLRRMTDLGEIEWFHFEKGMPSFIFDYPQDIAPMDDGVRALARSKALTVSRAFWMSLGERGYVTGTVVDQEGLPIQAEIRLDRGLEANGRRREQVWKSQDDGRFSLIFPSKDIYTLHIEEVGYVSAQKKIDLRSGKAKTRIVLRKE